MQHRRQSGPSREPRWGRAPRQGHLASRTGGTALLWGPCSGRGLKTYRGQSGRCSVPGRGTESSEAGEKAFSQGSQ